MRTVQIIAQPGKKATHFGLRYILNFTVVLHIQHFCIVNIHSTDYFVPISFNGMVHSQCRGMVNE